MTTQTSPEDEAALLGLVPEDGSFIGNNRLRRELEWEEARYFEVRDRLVDGGILSVGRGRGGTVYRARPVPATKAAEKHAKVKESALYRPAEQALRYGWSKTVTHHNYLVQVTARQGRKDTGGLWTRPDITVVVVDTYPYVPGKYLEVITYEIKPAGNWNVAGVFEAASHSRFATQTYLLIHTPDGLESAREEDSERLQKECTRFQIGLGLFRDPDSYDTYDFLVEPERRQPDPAEMNRFISQQLSDTNRRLISAWLK